MADGQKSVKARLAAKGYQDPDLQAGPVDTSGCVSLRSSHLQAISPCGIEKWISQNLDIKNAFLQADGFERDVFIQAPVDWGSMRSDRIWKLNAPAYGLIGALVAFHRSLKRRILNSGASMKRMDLRLQVSTLDPRLFFIFRGAGSEVGASTTHIGDILGRGEPDGLPESRDYLEQRFG